MRSSDEHAVCRSCGRQLNGKPYWAGGNAYMPNGDRAKVNHYGGYVCSESCDRRAELEQEQSMPGHGGQTSLPYDRSRAISQKWSQP